jgi:hypothetical protein
LPIYDNSPTIEDIIARGKLDATIKKLTKELGLGSKAYTPGVEGGYIGDGSGEYDSVQNAAAPLNTPQSGRRTVGRSQTPIVNNAETLDPQPALKDRIHQHQRDKYQLWQPGSAQDTKENLPAWSGIGDAPTMNDIETAAQKAQAAADAEKEKAKNEAKDLWRQYTDAVSWGTEDAFLASLHYGPGLEGFAQLYDDIQATLGESEFETLISETSPESAAVIWAPDAVSHPAGYYVDPDDYNSDEEYNKALLEGLRHNMQNGHSDAFLLENGYSSGAGGMMALNSDVEEALGKAGFHDFVDQLNAEQAQKEQSIAALSGMDDLPTMAGIKAVLKEKNEFFIDRDDFESEEDYKSAILEAIAQNPKHTNDILGTNGYNLPDTKKQIDNELKDMHPHYVEGSVRVIDGPFEGSGMVGVNDLVQGITALLDASGQTEGAGAMTPEIPSSSYKWYIVSADFDLAEGVENDTFQVNIYNNGMCRMIWRGIEIDNY